MFMNVSRIKMSALLLMLLISGSNLFAQRDLGARPTESGGPLSPEQAAYDVKHYDLSVRLDIPNQSIAGALVATVSIVNPLDTFVLDLDMAFTVSSVEVVAVGSATPIPFEHRGGKIFAKLATQQKPGSSLSVKVVYSGKPKVAPRPPWVGGFMWEKTQSGAPWIATAVQNDGADLWFPVKDHPSDKAETTSLHFTVPDPLVAAANGRLQSIKRNEDGTSTYNWFISQPISNYCIALNVAPYSLIKDEVRSVTGEMMPIEFYVTPEHFEKGKELIVKLKDYVVFFEKYLGPYPFRADKIGIAETPHLGMEHQSITAYGNNFKYDADGFDSLLFHEFGHEWWANLVTANDWNGFWIHEGFQSYMDTFFVEYRKGRQAYFDAMKKRRLAIRNVKPVAPRESRTTVQMYLMPPDYVRSDGDIYGKGALILHTLRYYIGDDAFFRSIRRMAYPDPAKEKVTDGTQNILTDTDEFLRIAERESGKKLGWFFEQYLRNASLPKLNVKEVGGFLELSWDHIPGIDFPMPIDIEIDGARKRVEVGRSVRIPLKAGAKYSVDPDGWVLKN